LGRFLQTYVGMDLSKAIQMYHLHKNMAFLQASRI